MKKRFLLSAIVTFACVAHALSQEPLVALRAPETPRGIELYQQGSYNEAIKVLRDAVDQVGNDFRARHYLALALDKSGDLTSARKEHEKAALLGEKVLSQLLDYTTEVHSLNRNLRTFAVQLVEAAESARRYVDLSPQLSKSEKKEWQLRLETLLGFAELAQSPTGTPPIYKSNEVDVRPRFIKRPEASYTEQARRERTNGVVVLAVVLGANGKVFGIHPIQTLPNGLTESAIRAARGIEFEPAVKNGRPVSLIVQVEYNFRVY